jgi:hypothetical protein
VALAEEERQLTEAVVEAEQSQEEIILQAWKF